MVSRISYHLFWLPAYLAIILILIRRNRWLGTYRPQTWQSPKSPAFPIFMACSLLDIEKAGTADVPPWLSFLAKALASITSQALPTCSLQCLLKAASNRNRRATAVPRSYSVQHMYGFPWSVQKSNRKFSMIDHKPSAALLRIIWKERDGDKLVPMTKLVNRIKPVQCFWSQTSPQKPL